jgi:glycosyltransferase involved in cell wall biosynthesis
MTVSIITICLNIVDTIERTLSSIFQQTYKDYELIVIDGGSTDGTLEIIRKYNNLISVFVSEPDKGIYNAMNKGLSHANGEFVFFLNGGDTFFSCQVLGDVFLRKPDFDILYGDIALIYGNQIEIYTTPSKVNRIQLFKRTLPHQCVFYSKRMFNKRIYNENYQISADYEHLLYCFLREKAKFKKVDLVISNFYMDGVSTNLKITSLLENEIIRKRMFDIIFRLKHDTTLSQRLNHYNMIMTHPRYIAGWIKQKLIKLWMSFK